MVENMDKIKNKNILQDILAYIVTILVIISLGIFIKCTIKDIPIKVFIEVTNQLICLFGIVVFLFWAVDRITNKFSKPKIVTRRSKNE